MKAGLSQHTQLKQELKINPRLYQAMDLLYMPLLDLQQHLKQELLNNPFLDMVEPEEDEEEQSEEEGVEVEAAPEEEKANNDEIDWEEILLDGFDTGGRREEHEEREYYEPVTVDSRNLADHLIDQIALLNLTPRQQFLADEFVGNVNEDGYLACPLEQILRSVNEEVERAAQETERDIEGLPLYALPEVEEMLVIVQNLDPPGVGARDLRECLMLQLREAGREQSVPHRLVRDCFEELINHRWSEISKRFGISPADVQKAADEIKLDHSRDCLQRRERQLHHPGPDRRQDRRPVSCLSQRREPAPPEAQQGVSGNCARQEKIRRREQGVHLQQAQFSQLDDPGHRATASDDAQGHELHRRPAARLLREGRAVPQAAHASRSGRGDQHARVDGEPRDE
jgi:DNA-directed RNA polymerase specialized sigma54-like protein